MLLSMIIVLKTLARQVAAHLGEQAFLRRFLSVFENNWDEAQRPVLPLKIR